MYAAEMKVVMSKRAARPKNEEKKEAFDVGSGLNGRSAPRQKRA
jgi:hypothetical protein